MVGTITVQSVMNVPPTVSITAPADGSTFAAPWTGTIQATAADSDGTVTKVDFFAGATRLGTVNNPSANLSFTVTNLAAGSYSLTAVATDNGGASTTSAAVHITVTNVPPTVSITAPADGSTFAAPWTGTIRATAADSDGTVTKVDFFAGATLLGTVNNPSTNLSFSTNLTAGSYTLTAVATDNGGASTTSAAVHITVVSPTPIRLSSAQRASGTSFQFSFTANTGLNYVVQRSADLKTWTPLRTNTATSSPVTFSDTAATGTLNFYRVLLLPNP